MNERTKTVINNVSIYLISLTNRYIFNNHYCRIIQNVKSFSEKLQLKKLKPKRVFSFNQLKSPNVR